VPDNQLSVINAKKETQFLLLCIVVVPEKIEAMTANLKSPLIINLDNQQGMQVVLDNVNYLIKQPVMQPAKG
jgi:flagellar assembly factor FliW